MAVLIVEVPGNKRGTVLPGRVLIGRRAMNHLVVDHPAVSRLHAWIDGEGDRYYINDAGSRTGTSVNGQRVVARHLLGDEDQITVGPATLTFLAESRVRDGVAAFDLSAVPPAEADEEGILFNCPSCAAPLWAGKAFAGRTGQCKYCGGDMTVPRPRRPASSSRDHGHAKAAPQRAPRAMVLPPPRVAPRVDEAMFSLAVNRHDLPDQPDAFEAPPTTESFAKYPSEAPAPSTESSPPAIPTAPRPSIPASLSFAAASAGPVKVRAVDQTCGVCQSPISVFEEQTTCPSCGLVFHAECWTENYGCSAYGCPHVDALKPAGTDQAGASRDSQGSAGRAGEANDDAAATGDPPNRFPWEFLLLAGSVVCTILGALTFGLPCLALAGGSIAYIARTRGAIRVGGANRAILLLSTGLAVVGVVVGAAASYIVYFGGSHF